MLDICIYIYMERVHLQMENCQLCVIYTTPLILHVATEHSKWPI